MPRAIPPSAATEPTGEAVVTAVTESTAATEAQAATAVKVIAALAPESAPSESVAEVEMETYRLPTRRMKPTEVARRGSLPAENLAPRL